jgi:hypothetical protein
LEEGFVWCGSKKADILSTIKSTQHANFITIAESTCIPQGNEFGASTALSLK